MPQNKSLHNGRSEVVPKTGRDVFVDIQSSYLWNICFCIILTSIRPCHCPMLRSTSWFSVVFLMPAHLRLSPALLSSWGTSASFPYFLFFLKLASPASDVAETTKHWQMNDFPLWEKWADLFFKTRFYPPLYVAHRTWICRQLLPFSARKAMWANDQNKWALRADSLWRQPQRNAWGVNISLGISCLKPYKRHCDLEPLTTAFDWKTSKGSDLKNNKYENMLFLESPWAPRGKGFFGKEKLKSTTASSDALWSFPVW